MRAPIKKRMSPDKSTEIENLPIRIGKDITAGSMKLYQQGKTAVDKIKSGAQKVKKFLNK